LFYVNEIDMLRKRKKCLSSGCVYILVNNNFE